MKLVCSGCLSTYDLEGPPGKEFRCRCGNKISMPQSEPKEQFGVVHCSGCWTRYAVAGRKSGAKFRCKKCGNAVAIRNTGTTAPEPAVGADMDNAQTQIISASEIKGAVGKKKPSPAAADAKDAPTRTNIEAKPRSRPSSRVDRAASRDRAPTQKGITPPRPSQDDAELKRRIGSQERELGELRTKTAEIEKERKTLARNLKDAEAMITAKDAEIGALNNRLNESRAEVKQVQENAANIHNALKEAGGEIQKMKHAAGEREKEVAGLKASIEALQQQVAGLNKDLETRATKEETERFYKDRAATEERFKQITTEVGATREALGGILGKAEALSSEIKGLQNEAGKFEELPDINSELQETLAAKNKAVKERDGLRGRIAELEGVLKEIRSQMETQDAEPQSVWQRGAQRIFGLFSRQETQATRTPPPVVAVDHGGTAGTDDDMIMPEDVEVLGEDLPPEPIPIVDDELLADEEEDTAAEENGRTGDAAGDGPVGVGEAKTSKLPRTERKPPSRGRLGMGKATRRKRRNP
ncbi:MAG: hypothetical protein JW909_00225 [Planctomycetes bacterium]|nr:hypothetical protein [Planctomycetota bacterium]